MQRFGRRLAILNQRQADVAFAGVGAVWAQMVTKDKEKGAALAYTCLTCGRCKVKCPMQIDTPSMIVELRKLIAEGEEPK